MKTFAKSALILSIIMMCAGSLSVWGQNRRSSASSSSVRSASSGSASRSSGSVSQSQRRSSASVSTQRSSAASSASRSASVSRSASSASTSNTRSYSGSSSSQRNQAYVAKPQASKVQSATSQSRSVARSSSGVSNTRSASRLTSSGNGSAASEGISARQAAVKSSSAGNVSSRSQSSVENSRSASRSQSYNDNNRVASRNQTAGSDKNLSTSVRSGNNSREGRQTIASANGRDNSVSHSRDHRPVEVHVARSHEPHHWHHPYIVKEYVICPAYSIGCHYFGYRLDVLPIGVEVVYIGGRNYWHHGGVYYTTYPFGGYVVCRPPIGAMIATSLFDLTLDLIRVNTALDAAKRAEEAAELAAYYAEKAENAEKKAARTAVELASEVGNANDNYYYQDGVFYVIENGQYKVIPAPIGAMVSELPEDYEEVVLNGKLYYQVDQTLFKLSASNGAPYFEVVSNI